MPEVQALLRRQVLLSFLVFCIVFQQRKLNRAPGVFGSMADINWSDKDKSFAEKVGNLGDISSSCARDPFSAFARIDSQLAAPPDMLHWTDRVGLLGFPPVPRLLPACGALLSKAPVKAHTRCAPQVSSFLDQLTNVMNIVAVLPAPPRSLGHREAVSEPD